MQSSEMAPTSEEADGSSEVAAVTSFDDARRSRQELTIPGRPDHVLTRDIALSVLRTSLAFFFPDAPEEDGQRLVTTISVPHAPTRPQVAPDGASAGDPSARWRERER